MVHPYPGKFIPFNLGSGTRTPDPKRRRRNVSRPPVRDPHSLRVSCPLVHWSNHRDVHGTPTLCRDRPTSPSDVEPQGERTSSVVQLGPDKDVLTVRDQGRLLSSTFSHVKGDVVINWVPLERPRPSKSSYRDFYNLSLIVKSRE